MTNHVFLIVFSGCVDDLGSGEEIVVDTSSPVDALPVDEMPLAPGSLVGVGKVSSTCPAGGVTIASPATVPVLPVYSGSVVILSRSIIFSITSFFSLLHKYSRPSPMHERWRQDYS